jgi:hypothetical protein
VCLVCCGPSARGQGVCFACRRVGHRLGVPLVPVFPVRLCPLPSPLYAVLLGYKESPVDEARRRFAPMVGSLFGAFLGSHGTCLAAAAGGGLEVALPVPSTARSGRAPLEEVQGLARVVCAGLPGVRWSPDVLARSSAPVGHMRPDAGAFEVPAAARGIVSGHRAMLLDDTYVSGARAQSAAAALRRAGARAVVIVALGRVLRPDRSPAHASFLRRTRIHPRATAGDATVLPCCRCVQRAASTE